MDRLERGAHDAEVAGLQKIIEQLQGVIEQRDAIINSLYARLQRESE